MLRLEMTVYLPNSLRDSLNDELDALLENFGTDPDCEQLAGFVIEQLELYADEEGHDDFIVDLEESGALEGSLQEELEAEMNSNDEFEFTGEEIVSLLERLCGIEWGDEDDDEEEDEDEDEDDDFL